MKNLPLLITYAFSFSPVWAFAEQKPNVLFIICDDLNDYVEGFAGHPQAKTPNIKRLADSGTSFLQAHCNIPICNPSRASMMSGLYPHTSQCFGFEHWDKNEVLKNSRTMMAHFRANGYHALGTGKVMHNRDEKEWNEFGHFSDYGPFANDGGKKDVAHPDVPSPFRDEFGAIDGSFGPLFNLAGRVSPFTGKPFVWRTGNWKAKRELRYLSDDDRDPTGDELNAQWAVKKLKVYAEKKDGKPFFMGVGFVRPHTPLIVPQKYFHRFPLDSIQLPDIRPDDAMDTFKHTLNAKEDTRGGILGNRMHDLLVASHKGDRELALRKFIQAYLASVASVDDLVGQVMEVVDNSSLKDNTVVIFTSDHGWGMGEKGYLYKNSLWQESTRVPLIVRAPELGRSGASCEVPVSLIDLYPTLIDLCGLSGKTIKNHKGKPLDGHSLAPLLDDPKSKQWKGPEAVLTAMYKWADYYDPAYQSYSLRSTDWRYVRYENGKEELYHTADDPHEWKNLALDAKQADQVTSFRKQLLARIPESKPAPKKSAEEWKALFFKKNPEADVNKDGKLSWPEFKTHKAKIESDKKKVPSKSSSNWIIPPPLEDLKKDYKVRLVYFVPSDREVKKKFQEKAEVLMRVVAEVYRREMKAHKLNTRGLDFEFGDNGRLQVHLVKAKNPAEFYTGKPFKVDRLLNTQQQEIWETTGFSRNRPCLVFSEAGAVAEARPLPQVYSGLACVSGDIFSDHVTATSIEKQIAFLVGDADSENNSTSRESQTSNGVLIHELGHIFGMLHDTRDARNIMMRGYDKLGRMFDPETAKDRPVRFSLAHARMASATRFFNESFDAKDTKPPRIQKFKPAGSMRGGSKTFDFTLKISDDGGLGSLVVLQRGGGQIDALVGELDLARKKTFSKTVTFECPRPLLSGQPLVYIMNVIDVNGNLSQSVINSKVDVE